MSWVEVASSRASGGGAGGATSVSATMGAAVAPGDLIWAAVVYESGGGGNITGVATDETSPVSLGVTDAEVQLLGPDVWLSLWKGIASEAGTPTVTATFNTSRNVRGIFIGAFTGNEATGAVNDALTEADASTASPSVALTTTVDGCLLLGVSINNNGVGATEGSGFSTVVLGGDGATYPIAFEWKEQATAGATVVDYTALSGTPTFVTAAAAFEPAAAGGPAQDDTDQWQSKNEWRGGRGGPTQRAVNLQRGEF